jgi:hypothetical protein
MLDTTAILLSTAAMFVIGFVLLFLIYYFTSTLYTEYGNARSRLYYSLVNSFYFSLVLAIMFALLPWLSDTYGVIASLGVGIVIILISTIVQVFAINTLVRRGIIRMKRKIRK